MAKKKNWGPSNPLWRYLNKKKSNSSKSIKSQGGRKMAKRKGYRRTKQGFKLAATLLGGALYGAGREKVSNMLAPLTSKIPLGNYGDEVAMGVLGYMLAKKTTGVLREVGKAALTIEAARVGAEVVQNGFMGGAPSNSSVNLW